jgi:hypothetical protein
MDVKFGLSSMPDPPKKAVLMSKAYSPTGEFAKPPPMQGR